MTWQGEGECGEVAEEIIIVICFFLCVIIIILKYSNL